MTKLAVLIPTHTLNLNDNEKKSLNKIVENYNREHIYFVLPEKIKKIKKPHNLNSVYFEDYFFSNHRNYNKLLLSKKFFEKFLNYERIFIYQLDCYLIKGFSELDKFLKYDYVGSPHINKKKKQFNGMLNGGLSIRAVKSSIDVLNSSNLNLSIFNLLSLLRYFRGLNRLKHFLNFITKTFYIFLKHLLFSKHKSKYSNLLLENFSNYFNEDIFWSLFSVMYKKNFNVVEPKIAIDFGFDKDPEELFIINNKRLPFACHNCWNKENNNFWKNYI